MNPGPEGAPTRKRNVSEFNADVRANGGYVYTTNAQLSSIAANRRMTEAILAALPAETASIIDIGCGDGTYTFALKQARPGMACTGFDPAEAAIESAGKRFPGVEYVLGDILDPATLPKRRFDVAILRGVVHHLPDGAAGIDNAARLADRIIMVEPNGDNPIVKWLERNSSYHIGHEEQSHPLRQLKAWCENGGRQVYSVAWVGFVPFLFPTLLVRMILPFQGLLERIGPLVRRFAGQIVIVYGKPPGPS